MLFSHFCVSLFNWLVRITDEGSVPEIRVWSILLKKSDLKWCIHLGRSLFFVFKLLGECHFEMIDVLGLGLRLRIILGPMVKPHCK